MQETTKFSIADSKFIEVKPKKMPWRDWDNSQKKLDDFHWRQQKLPLEPLQQR